MESVVFGFDVLVAVMKRNNYLSAHAVDERVEGVHSTLNFRDYSGLRFLPPSSRILAADALNSVVRVLPVRLVDAANLYIHRLFSCLH